MIEQNAGGCVCAIPVDNGVKAISANNGVYAIPAYGGARAISAGRRRIRLLIATALALFTTVFVAGLLNVDAASASGGGEKFSPLYTASLRNTLREFDEKEKGIYGGSGGSAITETATSGDSGGTSLYEAYEAVNGKTAQSGEKTGNAAQQNSAKNINTSQQSGAKTGNAPLNTPDGAETVEYLYFPGPVIPSVTSGYSCGATCGSTCGSTCTSTCTATCGATCGSTCGSTCTSTCTATCTATCSSTCGSTCAGSSSCTGSSTCAGSSSCAGSSTCAGSGTCAGGSTCVGTSSCAGSTTCAGSSSCEGSASCFGTSTCYGTNTCQGSSTCVGNTTCAGSSTCITGYTCSVTGPTGCVLSSLPPTGGGSSQGGTDNSTTGEPGGSGGGENGGSEPIDEALGAEPGDGSGEPPGGGTAGEAGETSAGETPAGESSAGSESTNGETGEPPGDVPGGENGEQPANEPDEPADINDEPDDWALEEVAKAIEAGYVSERLQSGYKTNITRFDFCEVLVNLLFKNGDYSLDGYNEAPSPFTDVDDVTITYLCDLGIVQGVGEGLFNPDGEITRQEAAVILRRAAIDLNVEDSGAETYFDDQDLIADWAVEALSFVFDKDIMKGVGGNMFDPLGTYTRQQAYMTIIRLADIIPVNDMAEDTTGI